MREKTHRLPPEQYRGAKTVAFTACIRDRKRAFITPDVVQPQIEFLEKWSTAFGCHIPAYCFMPDHLHVLFRGLEEGSEPLKAMIEFKKSSGLWLARNANTFRWQKDFYDHIIRSGKDWRTQAIYVLFNPVRAGLVEDPVAYPFSGCLPGDKADLIIEATWDKPSF